MKLVGNVHLVAGGSREISSLLALLRQEGVATAGNPDLSIRTYRTFGIDDARELAASAAARAIGSAQPSPRLRPARRTFVIVASSITAEAQNALLKTLEEAPGNALFFFLLPNPEALLPTVHSRAQPLSLPHVGHTMSHIVPEAFLRASPTKRLDTLKPLLEKDDDERRDIGAIISFLSELERALGQSPASLHAVYRARRYITDRGALVKPLLEQVALLV